MASRLPFDLNPQPKPINGSKATITTMPSQVTGRIDEKGNAVRNRILLSMNDHEYDIITPHLELIEMSHHQSLHESEDGLAYGYFPNTGLISLVIEINDGRSVEVGIVGREGFVGAPLAAGLECTPYRAVTQAPGATLRIKAEVLQVTLVDMPELRSRLIRYAVIQGMQVAQLAACNRLHEIDQRLARWLLMCQDRLGDDLLPMTHEFFAEMLGTGRPTVSVAAAVLQRAGFIQYARGTVKIIDREGLETAACECYRAIRQLSIE
jgi:CRP-like cAMP-binding protein